MKRERRAKRRKRSRRLEFRFRIESGRDYTVKSRRDCICLCHKGGIVVHIVACCDGMPAGLIRKNKPKKPPKKSK
jgi:hypothetical protein